MRKKKEEIPTRNHCGSVALLLHSGKNIKPSYGDTLKKSKETQYPKTTTTTKEEKNERKKAADLNWCTKNIRHKSLQQLNDICSEVVFRTSSVPVFISFTRTRHLISQQQQKQQQQRRQRINIFCPFCSPNIWFSLFSSLILITTLHFLRSFMVH